MGRSERGECGRAEAIKRRVTNREGGVLSPLL